MKKRIKISLLLILFIIANFPSFTNNKKDIAIIQTANAGVEIICPPAGIHYGKCHVYRATVTPWGQMIPSCEWTGYTNDFCSLSLLVL